VNAVSTAVAPTVRREAGSDDLSGGTWTPVCRLTDLHRERGAAALLGSGGSAVQVALFRLPSPDAGLASDPSHDVVAAVGHRDPFTGANVIARGIVGSRGDVVTVASPLYKQVFDLSTGQALDYPEVTLGHWSARVVDGVVELLDQSTADPLEEASS